MQPNVLEHKDDKASDDGDMFSNHEKQITALKEHVLDCENKLKLAEMDIRKQDDKVQQYHKTITHQTELNNKLKEDIKRLQRMVYMYQNPQSEDDQHQNNLIS